MCSNSPAPVRTRQETRLRHLGGLREASPRSSPAGSSRVLPANKQTPAQFQEKITANKCLVSPDTRLLEGTG